MVEEIDDLLDEALGKVTFEMMEELEPGEQIDLNEKYCLYRYMEDDIYVLNDIGDWEELYQVMYASEEDKSIVFEEL